MKLEMSDQKYGVSMRDLFDHSKGKGPSQSMKVDRDRLKKVTSFQIAPLSRERDSRELLSRSLNRNIGTELLTSEASISSPTMAFAPLGRSKSSSTFKLYNKKEQSPMTWELGNIVKEIKLSEQREKEEASPFRHRQFSSQISNDTNSEKSTFAMNPNDVELKLSKLIFAE